MTIAKAPLPKMIVILGNNEPRQDPIDQAKWEIITYLNSVKWDDKEKWHAFQMSDEFTKVIDTDENGEPVITSRLYVAQMVEALKNRIKGHFQRNGKHVKLVSQMDCQRNIIVYAKWLTGY